ncbi:terminase small subunit-like protein [Brucella thiophenivorans]|uniref:terminase small subunit-like protein n=1 Tax=Brucella thiophenivorans TaxID=571255 RepID=UPI000B99265A|nr:hypothetical protein [Brucella thiophenivorans]
MSDEASSVGRPAIFRQELADQICERIADGDSLRTICAYESFPSRTTVFKWLSHSAEFVDQYARAREASPINLTSLRERNLEKVYPIMETTLRAVKAHSLKTETFAIGH